MISRPRLWIPSVLVLALLFSWLGAALAHEHTPEPTCQVCKVIHNAPADLVRRTSAPEPLLPAERIASCPPASFHAPDLVVPRGRAPPIA